MRAGCLLLFGELSSRDLAFGGIKQSALHCIELQQHPQRRALFHIFFMTKRNYGLRICNKNSTASNAVQQQRQTPFFSQHTFSQTKLL